MNLVSAILDYLIWPALMAGSLAGLAYGTAHGNDELAFNTIYLCLALTLLFLERLRPHEVEWLKSDGQEMPDLLHTLITKLPVQVIVIVVMNFGIAEGFRGKAGGGLWPVHWPMLAQIILGLVILEFGLYWAHRIAHQSQWLWRFHAVHHSSKKLWFFNTGRFHFIDTIKSIVFSIPLLALAGAPGTIFVWMSAITAFIGILTHCNVRMRFGWLNYIFNTPGLHRWHHSMDFREGNMNYGENIMCWDLLFGTYFNDAKRRPPREIGIKEKMPEDFFGQIVAPFVWNRFQENTVADESQDARGRHKRSSPPPKTSGIRLS
jgi:sterol desaturase/sphingolipid hydroxylase (fatty acid hydroxylase superfamily)